MTVQPDPILTMEGTTLNDGWTVRKLLKAGPVGSGGHFSICYLVERSDGALGFLKAFDFRQALESLDIMRSLQELTTAFNFEKDLLWLCQERKIKKVVTAMSHGDVDVAGVPLNKIFYIIFELADGDARQQMSVSRRLNFCWIYSALHQISIGLRDLHRNGIYHQDLKPSNVLIFGNGMENKIADLGRSHCNNLPSPHGDFTIPGFVAYAPPEQLYGHQIMDSHAARSSGDLYQLGSLLLFFFTGQMATPAIMSHVACEHLPLHQSGWTGEYFGVIPYLTHAFNAVVIELEDTLSSAVPQLFHSHLVPKTVALFKLLTALSPMERGHPSNRKSASYSAYDLERVISELDVLAKKAALVDRINAKAA